MPQRNNNPGNIKAGGLSDDLATGTDSQGHLVFPTPEAGFEALIRDVQAKVSGNSKYLQANPTLAQLGSVYAEDPNWSNSVAKILGVTPETKTQTIPIKNLVLAIASKKVTLHNYMENTELKKLLESYNQDPKLKDLFNRSYGSSQDIETAIKIVENYKANVAGSKVEPKESLLKRIVKEPIEALVVRPVARTTEALGRVVLVKTYKEVMKKWQTQDKQLDTIAGKYNIRWSKDRNGCVKQIGGSN